MKITFKIEYFTRWGESLRVRSGRNIFPMSWVGDGQWAVTIDDCPSSFLKDYTYEVISDGLVLRTEWESHSCKAAKTISDKWIECPIPGCLFPRKHSAEMFDRPHFRGAGTAVPVFSLRGKNDFGIGEFYDLIPLADWAAATGQCIIQLLPINDTSRNGDWDDSYPYNPISSFALNPLYINLQELGVKKDGAFVALQQSLNNLPEIDYPAVYKAKMMYIHRAFDERGAKDIASAAFKRFCLKNAFWLEEYSSFCARRDKTDKTFYEWLQFHLDKQLAKVVEHCHSKGVYLKGDLPIGVSRDSAEADAHPELFNLDSSAGAPPDYFSREGQNWHFPTYNWDEMAKDGYAWWRARLRKMAEYFDAFRIDHILGFFRIWEIPVEHSSGLEGHFNPAMPYSAQEIADAYLPIEGLFHEDPRHPGMYQPLIMPDSQNLPMWQQERFGAMYNDFFFHRHDEFWRREAEKKLPFLLGATGMLACGEDLGMVPDCVPSVMDHHKILSLKMRGFDQKGGWNECSVCATSSHDMQTLRMQFDHDPGALECRAALKEMLHTPSMLAIFPIQDWLSADETLRRTDRDAERINEPANPHHHWRYRMHINVTDLCAKDHFNGNLLAMIRESGR